MTPQDIQQAVTAGYNKDKESFSISGAKLISPAITRLLTAWAGSDTLDLMNASTPSDTPDGASVEGCWTPAQPLLGLAFWQVAATFASAGDDVTLTITLNVPQNWSPTTVYPALAKGILGAFEWGNAALTLGTANPGLPANFPAQLGYPAHTTTSPLTGLYLSVQVTPKSGQIPEPAADYLTGLGDSWTIAGPLVPGIGRSANVADIYLTSPQTLSASIGNFTGTLGAALAAVTSPQAPTAMLPLLQLNGGLQIACTLDQTPATVEFDAALTLPATKTGNASLIGTIKADSPNTIQQSNIAAVLKLMAGDIIPDQLFQDMNEAGLTLQSVELSFSGGLDKPSIDSVAVAVVAAPPQPIVLWKSGDGSARIELDEIDVTVGYMPAFASNPVNFHLEGMVSYVTGDGIWTLDMKGAWPECLFSLTLSEGQQPANALGFVQTAADGLPDWASGAQADILNITGILPFGSQAGIQTPELALGIALSSVWTYTDASGASFSLQGVEFALRYAATKPNATYSGSIGMTMLLGSYEVAVQANYQDGVWRFLGSLNDQTPPSFADLYLAIAKHFPDAPQQAPDWIPSNVALSALTVEFDGADKNQAAAFSFSLGCTWTLGASDEAMFGFRLERTANASFEADAYFWLGEDSFQVGIKNSTATVLYGNWIANSVSGQLDLRATLAALGADLSALPSSLDLAVSKAEIAYDATGQTLVLSATAADGSALALFVQWSGADMLAALGIAAATTIDLSDLPLIDKMLPEQDRLTLQDMSLWIGTGTFSGLETQDPNLQAIIEGWNLPASLTSFTHQDAGAFAVLSASLSAGGESQSLTLSLTGTSQATIVPETASHRAAGAADSAGSGVIWYRLQKSLGPLTISAIGIGYDLSSQAVSFLIDAGLAFGPLSLTLDDLSVTSPIRNFSPSFGLSGVGIGYDAPPLHIAGSLLNLSSGNDTVFEGSITLGAADFTILGAGYYGDRTGEQPSMFLFVELLEDLGGPPAFFVTGVLGGLGYNSTLTLPTVDKVENFPFVAALPQSGAPQNPLAGISDPSKILDIMSGGGGNPVWVSPALGNYWAVIGVTFTSFEVVKGELLAAATLGGSLEIALLGTATATLPQKAASEQYAVVTLDIDISVKPDDGAFSAQALIAKGSYLLDPAAALSGGFALDFWFGNNPNAGDFILTIGGYNPSFVPPAYYPTVPVVGVDWTIDDSLTVKGGGYLAVTPAVMMAGVALSITYQSGNFKAWLDASADMVIAWAPFTFSAEIGVSVGASYRLTVLGVSKTLSASIGCTLALWGPPTGGTVRVDWTVFSVTIAFGSQAASVSLKDWNDVQQTLLPRLGAPSLAPSAGLLATVTKDTGVIDAGPGDPVPATWIVMGGSFTATVGAPVPATGATLNGTPCTTAQTASFCVSPLGISDVTSTISITLTDTHGNQVDGLSIGSVSGDVPAAIWGTPPATPGAPVVPDADDQLVSGLVTALTLSVASPTFGATAGTVTVAGNLDYDTLPDTGQIGLESDATGDIARYAPDDITSIAGTGGIGDPGTASIRTGLFQALNGMGFALTGNDDMSSFATDAANGAVFNDIPLTVPQAA